MSNKQISAEHRWNEYSWSDRKKEGASQWTCVHILLAKKTGFVYCIDRKRSAEVKEIVRQIPKKIQDIDPFTYEMPFEEGIAASTIRATLCTLPQNEAMELISDIITPKFTVLFPADRGKLRPSPDVGVHIKQDKLALVIESVSEYSSIFLEEGLDDADIEDESVKNALRKIMDMLNEIDGESIAKNCSSQFTRFLLDCYMTLI